VGNEVKNGTNQGRGEEGEVVSTAVRGFGRARDKLRMSKYFGGTCMRTVIMERKKR